MTTVGDKGLNLLEVALINDDGCPSVCLSPTSSLKLYSAEGAAVVVTRCSSWRYSPLLAVVGVSLSWPIGQNANWDYFTVRSKAISYTAF